MGISSTLAKTVSKIVNTGIDVTKALLGLDVSTRSLTSKRVGTLSTPVDGDSLHKSTEILGLIYRQFVRKRTEELQDRLDKAEKSTDIEDALDQQNKETINAINGIQIPQKTTAGKISTPNVSVKKPSPSKVEPTTKGKTSPVQKEPIIPSGVSKGVGIAAAAAGGALAISKIIEVGKNYNVVQLASGEIVKREGSWNWRNNNPGNIEYGDYALKHGAIPYAHGTNKPQKPEERFAVFPTYEMGRQAKASLIFDQTRSNHKLGAYGDLTIDKAIEKYAPQSENDVAAYQNSVKSALRNAGVDEKTIAYQKMRDYTPEQRATILSAMEKQEGYGSGKQKTTVIQKAPKNVEGIVDDGSRIDESSKQNKELKKNLVEKQSPIVTTTTVASRSQESSSDSEAVSYDDKPAMLRKMEQ